jgi:hypothetical protein
MTKLKDNFWLWGQNPGSHHGTANYYKLPGRNLMDAREGCKFLGIEKCCRVAMTAGPFPPFDTEAEKIKDLKEVVWSAVGAGGIKQHNDGNSDLDEVLRMAEIYPNVSGAVLDDFFSSIEFADSKPARHSVESIKGMRDRLHNFSKRRLDLWLVWYTYQLNYNVQAYADLCDVITIWTWKGCDLSALKDNIAKAVERTPGKRRLAGCYMWNYGEQKPLSIEQMEFQCETYRNAIKAGQIEGIIFCSNCIADIGLETVGWTKNWISKTGSGEI